MSASEIADYGLLSDCASAALVSRNGSIDWWCPGRFDAPSVFGRLLDADAGHWTLCPVAASDRPAEREYVEDSLVLRTVHHSGDGAVAVTEGLVAEPGARGHELGRNSPMVLARVVEGLTGTVRMRCEYVPRPDYGLIVPYLHCRDGQVLADAGPLTLHLYSPVPLDCAHGRAYAEFDVSAGQVLGFHLASAPAYGPPPQRLDPAPALAETVEAWRVIRELHPYAGRYPELVRRSALVVQGLTYRPSGAVVAAVTMSLPARLGGTENYDYRYAWLRDFILTMRALWVTTCPEDTGRLFDWAGRSAGRTGDEPVPIMYGVTGERDLSEYSLDHLHGYAGSRPVRVGNDAWRQRQHDVPGVLIGAYLLRDELRPLSDESKALFAGLAEQATHWREPDAGMWEDRGPGRHYVASKAMCWGALDSAVKLAPIIGSHADPERWAAVRDEIRATLLRDGWNDRVGAYTGVIGSPELDASVLVMPGTGIVPATDPRMRATIEAIATNLMTDDGLVRRWPDDPAGFVACTFWLVECLAMAGETERAAALFERTAARANDLGLFAEQIDPRTGEHLGNTPLALSHVGLIGAAWRLTKPEFD